MSKVKVLSAEISNKIAAGEVVERPASVVKELIENAVDAGATSITVEIKNGGISYIRVTDNGLGMDSIDAKTAFLPHATSKISTTDDLEKIETLGFRGEALASIAAVSNVEIMTKTNNTDGVFLQLSGGIIKSDETVGCPEGTTIVIKNLFFNTPARMKFLKKDSTETGYISDIVERLVLSNPKIALKYIADGKERLFFGGDGELKSCIYSVYGRDYAKNAVEINRFENNIKVSGFVGKSETSRGNRAFQSFFVNGRYVKNRSLTFWAEKAYQNILMVGKFPFFAIHINLPFDAVDINVHPTKQEVKFADEKTVCNEMYWAIKNSLDNSADEIRADIKNNLKPNFLVSKTFEKPQNKQINFSYSKPMESMENTLSEPVHIPILSFKEIEHKQEEEANYKIIGQLFDTYIVIELKDKIILIDQHAAHERMLYEKLLKLKNDKQMQPQLLLSPIAITLSSKEYLMLEEKMDIFIKMGFDIDDFGNNSIIVRQTPIDIGDEGLKNLIVEILEKSKGEFTYEKEIEALHTIACKAAIKANDKLQKQEIDSLIDEILKTGGINTCPHGRPIMVSITRYELEKMFKRVQ